MIILVVEEARTTTAKCNQKFAREIHTSNDQAAGRREPSSSFVENKTADDREFLKYTDNDRLMARLPT